MKYCLILNIFLFFVPHYNALAKSCLPKIIKSYDEIEEKLKICDKGDKILVIHDIKVVSDRLILKICDLRYPVLSRDEPNIIHKRNSGVSFICIYDPDF